MEIADFENKIRFICKDSIDTKKLDLNSKFEDLYVNKTVLGIDIYEYSKYELAAQSLIPYIFYKILYSTLNDLKIYEPIFFSNSYVDSFKDYFIHTGDGGYVILDNPIQALLFAIYLSSKFKIFNTGNLESLENEFKIIDQITYRYSLCYGKMMKLNNNWFGPAIISCARILSIDKLNRFIIDNDINGWFEKNINGIETLLSIGLNNLATKPVLEKYFKEYDTSNSNQRYSLIFPKEGKDPGLLNSNILNIHLSKIGSIEIKKDKLSVYNLYLQVYIVRIFRIRVTISPDPSEKKESEKYVVSIGNLNVLGLK